MTLREFIKSFSFYGFLPVFTKFAGFLLVPVYVRVLSQSDYGIAELILSTVGFLTYVINLEFYGAVGRFFFDRESLRGRQKLISTGLYLTLASALVVAALGLVFQGSARAAVPPGELPAGTASGVALGGDLGSFHLFEHLAPL